MSFNAAELVATIQLGGVSTAERDLNRFKGKLEQTDSSAAKLSKSADAVFRGTATAIGVASVAAAAFVTNLFQTGVAYNQLQQTSRAALRTLLGGAEAANAQMDKLDAFAKTSPFSKSVFISAQQQLIGFGFEAQKVIPILNSVQNAVAAVGGSNQQISEIVSILAKIRSSGKLTAEDLNMLGERGLDAATLLGQGFGKSAGEIRESITKGTLDAAQAVDVLVAQMDAKFAGAAANVKETYAGTVDRIKAASRDIGAALAEPFVSKNGGGLFVTWGNQVADIMRAVESHTTPVVNMLTARAAPAFADITQMLDRARVQVKSWDSSRLEDGLDAMASHAPAIAATAGAILGVNSQLLASIPIVGRFVPAFSPLAGAIAAAALASPELRAELGALLGTLKPLLPVTVDIATVFSGVLNAALPIVADGIKGVVAIAEPFVDVLEAIPAPVLATTIAAVGMFTAMRNGAPAIQGLVDGVKRIAEQAAVQAALAGMEGNTSKLAGTFGVAGKAATGLGNSLKAAFITNPVGLILIGVSTAAAVLTAALSSQAERSREAKDRIQGYRDSLDQTTGALLRATRAQIEKNLAESDMLANASRVGLSKETIIRSLMGEADAVRAVAAATEKYRGEQAAHLNLYDETNRAGLDLVEMYDRQAGEIAEAAAETRRDAEEKRRATAAMSDLQRSNERMNESLAIARDHFKDATERLRALKGALDELNGGTKSQADFTRDLNEQTNQLRESFAQVDDAGNRLAPTLVSAAGAIDTTTAAGIALYDGVSRLNDAMLDEILAADAAAKKNGEHGVSMDEAREIASKYQDRLRGLGEEAGLSDEQMSGLVATMLQTPEVVAFMVDDSGTIDAEQLRLIDLATRIIATPDGSFEVHEDSIPGLMEALRVLGVDITTLPEGSVKVKKDDGTFITVQDAINGLTKSRTVTVFTQWAGSGAPVGTGTVLKPDRAFGGPVQGPGTNTSDSIPANLSNDEHVWTASEVFGAGGHGKVALIRSLARQGRLGEVIPGFRDGGPVIRADRLPQTTLTLAPVRTSTAADRAPEVSPATGIARAAAVAARPLDLSEAAVDALARRFAREVAAIVRTDQRRGGATGG